MTAIFRPFSMSEHRPLFPWGIVAATAVIGLTTPLPAAYAQAKKAAAKSPASKPAPPAGGKQTIVLGTNQLAGDFGQLGQTYTIGKPDADPTNFTLDRVEYSVAPFVAGMEHVAPKADEKLLILHYTVHNPRPVEQSLDWSSIKFTAVDARDVNHENANFVVREGTREGSVSIQLKPAQKLAVQTVLVVPAAGVVPKLIVQREEGAAVVRYDLRGKAAPLPAPFADPADKTGATARTEVPAQAGTFYPLGQYDVKLEGVAFSTATIEDTPLEEGQRFLVGTLTLRNALGVAQTLDWGFLSAGLADAAGEKYEPIGKLFKASRDEGLANTDLKPGEETRVRIFVAMPANATPKTLRLAAGEDSRAYLFDVSSAK